MEKININYHYDDDELTIAKMKEAYFNSPTALKYCTSLEVKDEEIEPNIAKIYDFVCDIEYCKKCPGLKNCKKSNPHLVRKLIREFGHLKIQLTPCKRMLEKLSFERQFLIKDFSNEWLDTVLKNLDQTAPRKVALMKYNKFIKTNDPTWLYLNGGPNSGRSYFAASIVVDAARKGKGPICFLNASQRIRELVDLAFNRKNSEEFQKVIDQYSTVPILAFDDFGNEFISDYVRDAIIIPILNARSSLKLFTIFTSDFTLDEIKTLYSNQKGGAIKANNLYRIIKNNIGEEINLGELSIY